MKVYITKYALTQGILEAEAEETNYAGMIRLTGTTYSTCFHGEGKQWHRTLTDAETRRDEMLRKERKRLEKALKDLDQKAKLPLRKYGE